MSQPDSRKVRTVLKFYARAAKLQARYDQTVTCAAPLRTRAEALRQAAAALERSLTDAQRAELARARGEAPHPNPGGAA